MDTINISEEKDVIELIIDRDTNINIFNKNIEKLNINVLNDVSVNINEFHSNNILDRDIKIIINSNANLIYNISSIVCNNYKLNILIDYIGHNSKVDVNIHSIVEGYEKIDIVGNVLNEYKDNILLENVKVMLIDKGMCEVNPIMKIDTNNVNAFHKVAISNIRKEELFYLMSKGLEKITASSIIKKSFLISNITNKEIKNKIDKMRR